MKKWEILNKFRVQNLEFRIEDLINLLLENRGILTEKEREEFLHPDLSQVTIERVGIDAEQVTKAIKRIRQAIEKKEQVIVYGDYDVDGITSSAIIWETLHDLKASIMPYIPSRMEEGYGLSVIGIENLLLKYPDTRVIITVDNGIVAHQAVAFAKEKGIDVIITDHHVAESDHLPECYTLVHTTKLCGAGVAYLFSKEIKKAFSYVEEKDTHLELAALGTVADLVPLTGANRAIVTYGIKALCSTERPGLQALFTEAACEPSTIGVYQIGHIIAPRLNATGRIEHAMDSLRLLCTTEQKRAMELAVKIGITNRERQMIMRTATEDAIEKFKLQDASFKKILIIDDEKYQEGVIGLVAGKLVEEFYRPAIVISRKEKVSKGSVRSVSGFNIIEFLRTHGKDHFVNVGGHPMAAGFTIETEKIVLLKNILEEQAEGILTDDLLQRTVKIDCLLPLPVVTNKLYQELQKLSPFGMGNPEPVFQSDNVVVSDLKVIGKEGQHLRLYLTQDNAYFEAIAFNMGDLAVTLHKGKEVSIAYTIDENTWNGNTKLQLKIRDIK